DTNGNSATFANASVSVPAPALVRPPAPLLPIALANVALLPFVSMVPPLALRVTVRTETSAPPDPAAHRSTPPLKVSGPVPRLLTAAISTTPALTLTPPLNVLFPPRTRTLVPVPLLTLVIECGPPVSEITPFRTAVPVPLALTAVAVRSPLSVTGLAAVDTALLFGPTVTAPLMTIGRASVPVKVKNDQVVPFLNVMVPVPAGM